MKKISTKLIAELVNAKRKELIKAFKINPDYNKPVYECEKCSDTGFDENGARCSCVRQRTGEAEIWQKRDKQTS